MTRRLRHYTVDVSVPPPGVHPFDFAIPGPATFVRAHFVMANPSRLAGVPPEQSIRLVFVVEEGAMAVRRFFKLSTPEQWVDVGDPAPRPLDSVVVPPSAVVMLWDLGMRLEVQR